MCTLPLSCFYAASALMHHCIQVVVFPLRANQAYWVHPSDRYPALLFVVHRDLGRRRIAEAAVPRLRVAVQDPLARHYRQHTCMILPSASIRPSFGERFRPLPTGASELGWARLTVPGAVRTVVRLAGHVSGWWVSGLV